MAKDKKEETKEERRVKGLLAEFIGVEVQDVSEDDSLVEDLHMSPTDLTDFTQLLKDNGIETSDLDIGKVETVSDLLEALALEF